jgi:predicted phage replisome organizer
LPEADGIIVIWFKLLCLAGKQNNSGVFTMNGIPYTDKMLATIFRRKETTVQLALNTFEQFGMIEIIDNVITIPNWGKHQNLDSIEAKNEYMRNYMATYRIKQKQIADGKTNSKANGKANVSQADKIREDKEEDKEYISNEIYSGFSPEFQKVFKDYIEMRIKIKKPMTERAKKMAIDKLNELSKTEPEQIHIIEQSIFNSWQGFFPLKELQQSKSNSQPHRKTSYDINEYGKIAMEELAREFEDKKNE